MTVQQHAPRLAGIGTFRVPTATLLAVGAVILIVAAAIGTWLLVQPAAISVEEFRLNEMLHRLRETLPGGGFI